MGFHQLSYPLVWRGWLEEPFQKLGRWGLGRDVHSGWWCPLELPQIGLKDLLEPLGILERWVPREKIWSKVRTSVIREPIEALLSDQHRCWLLILLLPAPRQLASRLLQFGMDLQKGTSQVSLCTKKKKQQTTKQQHNRLICSVLWEIWSALFLLG